VAFTYLKVKSAKCLCLLPVVLVLRTWSRLRRWSRINNTTAAFTSGVRAVIRLTAHSLLSPSVKFCSVYPHRIFSHALAIFTGISKFGPFNFLLLMLTVTRARGHYIRTGGQNSARLATRLRSPVRNGVKNRKRPRGDGNSSIFHDTGLPRATGLSGRISFGGSTS